jgi:hypothetical protein
MSYSSIQFDYEDVQGQRICSILGTVPLLYNDGHIAFDAIKLVLTQCELQISVDNDSDEIVVNMTPLVAQPENLAVEWEAVEFFSDFLDGNIGWLWIAQNHLGYSDTLILSSDGIEPQILLHGMASKLNLYRIVHSL